MNVGSTDWDRSQTDSASDKCYLGDNTERFVFLNSYFIHHSQHNPFLSETTIQYLPAHKGHLIIHFLLAARDLLYASSHKQDITYHGICYISCGALAGTRNDSIGPPRGIDPMTHYIIGRCSTAEQDWIWLQELILPNIPSGSNTEILNSFSE